MMEFYEFLGCDFHILVKKERKKRGGNNKDIRCYLANFNKSRINFPPIKPSVLKGNGSVRGDCAGDEFSYVWVIMGRNG